MAVLAGLAALVWVPGVELWAKHRVLPVRHRTSSAARQPICPAHWQRDGAVIMAVVLLLVAIPILTVARTEVAEFGAAAEAGVISSVVCGPVLEALQALLHALGGISTERDPSPTTTSHTAFSTCSHFSPSLSARGAQIWPLIRR